MWLKKELLFAYDMEFLAGDDYTMALTSKGKVLVASDKDYDKHNADQWKLF